MYRQLLPIVFFGMAAALVSGCGGPASATVEGEVAVNGEPLKKGFIAYAPIDGNGTPVTAEIRDGKYELRTVEGNKRVQISAPVVTGKRPEFNGPNAPLVETTEESLPDRYHSKSELTFEVKAGGNTKNWSVETKTKKP